MLIAGMRFEESTGTMVPHPGANTSVEIKRMLAWQADHGALAAARMPASRKAKARQITADAARARAHTTGSRPLADVQSGRKARAARARADAEARALAEASQVDQTTAALEAAGAELERERKRSSDLARQLAAAPPPPPPPASAQLQETRDMVSALLDHALEVRRDQAGAPGIAEVLAELKVMRAAMAAAGIKVEDPPPPTAADAKIETGASEPDHHGKTHKKK